MTTTKKTTTKKTTVKTVKTKASPIPNLPNNPFTFEVLDAASKQRTKAKKVEVLQKYKHPSLITIFVWNFDTSIISLLPEGEVPYGNFEDDANTTGTLTTKVSLQVRKMHEAGSFSMGSSDKQGHTTIRREAKNFYRFIRGGQDSLSNLRRETFFINILEGLHPLEAEVLILVKDKRLEEQYNISKEIVSLAFPDIIWGDA